MKIIFIIFIFAIGLRVGNAQTPPSTILEISKQSDSVIKKGDLTSEQRAYLWDKTVTDRAGFLVVEVNKDYQDTIKYFESAPDLNTGPLPALKELNSELNISGFNYVGNLMEDRYRYNIIYRAPNLDLLMITKWEYKKAGASISSAEEFFNQNINGSNGVLSLAVSENQVNAIWKLTWSSEGVLYEIYLSEKLDSYGKPEKVPEDIVSIANKVAKYLGKKIIPKFNIIKNL